MSRLLKSKIFSFTTAKYPKLLSNTFLPEYPDRVGTGGSDVSGRSAPSLHTQHIKQQNYIK